MYQWFLALFEVLLDYNINDLCFVILSDMQSI